MSNCTLLNYFCDLKITAIKKSTFLGNYWKNIFFYSTESEETNMKKCKKIDFFLRVWSTHYQLRRRPTIRRRHIPYSVYPPQKCVAWDIFPKIAPLLENFFKLLYGLYLPYPREYPLPEFLNAWRFPNGRWAPECNTWVRIYPLPLVTHKIRKSKKRLKLFSQNVWKTYNNYKIFKLRFKRNEENKFYSGDLN